MDDGKAAVSALAEAFPEIVLGIAPLGARVVVQLKLVRSVSKGGIALPEEARQVEEANTAVARVVALGPLAFRHRDTLEPWKEGVWVRIGDFVRVPRWGGDRISLKVNKETVTVVILNDHELIAKITGDPLEMRGYV